MRCLPEPRSIKIKLVGPTSVRSCGVKVARKHISWYTKGLAGSASFRHRMNQLETCKEQLEAVDRFFEELACGDRRLRYVEETPMELAA